MLFANNGSKWAVHANDDFNSAMWEISHYHIRSCPLVSLHNTTALKHSDDGGGGGGGRLLTLDVGVCRPEDGAVR